MCSGIVEQNINVITGALLDGNCGCNVRKIFLPCKTKKFLSSDRTVLKVVLLIAILSACFCSRE